MRVFFVGTKRKKPQSITKQKPQSITKLKKEGEGKPKLCVTSCTLWLEFFLSKRPGVLCGNSPLITLIFTD
jgi:hypothetical protein